MVSRVRYERVSLSFHSGSMAKPEPFLVPSHGFEQHNLLCVYLSHFQARLSLVPRSISRLASLRPQISPR
jgi:hypothetical protein